MTTRNLCARLYLGYETCGSELNRLKSLTSWSLRRVGTGYLKRRKESREGGNTSWVYTVISTLRKNKAGKGTMRAREMESGPPVIAIIQPTCFTEMHFRKGSR